MKPNLSGNDSRRKDHRFGWAGIPNCEAMRLFNSDYDPIWREYFDLDVRTRVKHIQKGPNSKMNKYMNYQLKRLSSQVGVPRRFWNTVRSLLGKSISFRLAAFHKVIPNWSREIPMRKMNKIVREVSEILDRFNSNDKLIEYTHCAEIRRVYFMDRDKWRPLGVPTIPWRIVTHMINNFLCQFLYDHFLPTQHGFIPGRGTLTAWVDVFKKIVGSRWVLETDLKGFFTSVIPEMVTIDLRKAKVAPYMVDFLGKVNKSNFVPPKDIKTTSDLEMVQRRLEGIKLAMVSFGHVTPFFPNFIDHKRTPINWGYSEGLPQGLPISPIQSILTLPEFLSQQRSISYADDPIFYGEEAFDILSELRKKITLSLEKTFWIKQEGVWLRKLKWLGLEYDPFKDTLTSSTRKVKTGEMSPLEITPLFRDFMITHQKIEHLTVEKRRECIKKGYFAIRKNRNRPWSELLESRLGGFIMSKLYTGSWSENEVDQDFTLKGCMGSWVYIKQREGIPLTIRNYSTHAQRCLAHLLKSQSHRKYKLIRYINSPLPVYETWNLVL